MYYLHYARNRHVGAKLLNRTEKLVDRAGQVYNAYQGKCSKWAGQIYWKRKGKSTKMGSSIKVGLDCINRWMSAKLYTGQNY